MTERSEAGSPAAREERRELQERIADWLDIPLAVLALIMLGLLIVDFTVPLSPGWARRVGQAQTIIWIIFAADFLFELALAPSKVRYLKENWLTALAVALPALRAVRLLRVAHALRGLSLVRMMTALDRGTRALGQIARRGQLGYVLLLTLAVTATAAAGAYYLERDEPGASIGTPGDALWWAATIVTTINSPLETVTFEGRVIGLLLRVFALAISGYLTATIAVYLLGRPQSTAEQAEASELAELRREVRRLGALLERRLPEGGRAGGRDRVA